MTYETVMHAYNSLKGMPIKALEARAQAINADISANANADLTGYGIELEAIERIIEEKQTQPEARAQAPQGIEHTASSATTEDKAATPEYRHAFFKQLLGHTLTTAERTAFDAVNGEKRGTDYFNNLSNSAAIIPTKTLEEIVVKAREQGGILSACRQFALPANLRIPVATPIGAAQWHTEGAKVDTELAATVPVSFAAYEIMRIISVSAATRVMSIGAFESYLVDELTASIMACLANGIVSGSGVDEATGIIEGITWTDADEAGENDLINKVTVAANERLGFGDVVEAMALLKRGYARNAKWAINNATLYRSLYSITDEVNRPIVINDVSGSGPSRILGHEVIVDDYLPDDVILFGDFNFYGANIPERGIALDVSRESSFKSGLVDYRALAIADAKPIVDEAFVMIAKATE